MGKSGDFTYASAARRAAEEYSQTERSDTERAADKAKRAPVTTDYHRWKSDPAGLDFPGVDTPTAAPGVLPKDLKQGEKPSLSARARDERPATPVDRSTKELEQREAKRRGVSPGEDRSSMVSDGMGGVRFNANIGGYVETDAADEEMRPPGDAIERQDEFLSIESRERQAADAGVLDPKPSDPFDMSDDGGALDSRDSRQIEFGGQQVDLGQKDEEELKGMREMLNRNLDAEVDAQRMKGGTEPSSTAQDFADRAFEVDQELFDRGLK